MSMVQYCFKSTETRRLVRTDSPRTATSTLTQLLNSGKRCWECGIIIIIIIIIMYIYHALINALSDHLIHINLNMIFYTHVEHSPTKTIYIKYY